MSGLLMAASAALLAAVALGGLAAATAQSAYRVMWWHVALSSASLALLAYLVLMFIATARRLYSTYLEVYENGAPLRKPRRRSQR
ncbi:hypothetical protein HQO12_13450 [Rhodococcus fascians]|uniref:hypothetical protein n=1 Tax=Rhodococcoides fascians TaxID=1828 RepID=UPI00195D906E|nr:hypothetical protein [Rhodococcus fascians]MBM7243445.1 hypothetical protein [Rhodococcus fascians]MBY3809908.1 hypothetical protein [Rhodococcus fascians]MBY3841411.1 hypothetical protein [Rhodococcus fascians]MBY3844920.1 hypothetical protein [Rhodococcus fascians]MBY3850617.1 hypothetical protein [Rhodococcus fascians]